MTGRPRRAQAKVAVQLRCNADIRQRLAPLLACATTRTASLSGVLEGVLLLAKSIYIEEDERTIVRMFYDLKACQLQDVSQRGEEPQLAVVHVTLDHEACEFADFLVRRFPQLFHTRSELSNALLLYTSQLCAREQYAGYVARRLRYVARMRPRERT